MGQTSCPPGQSERSTPYAGHMARRPAGPWTVGVLVLTATLSACRPAPETGATVTLTPRTTIATTTTMDTFPTTVPGTGMAAFEPSVLPVTRSLLGSSWREECPVDPDDLRLLLLQHWDFTGEVRTGELIVHRESAEDVVEVFEALYAATFPIERIELVHVFGSDDDLSMAANNTSGFNCRPIAGTSRWSEHAYGRAIDINPVQNPYVRGPSTVLPPAGGDFLDRSDVRPGMVVENDIVEQAFSEIGWVWGGRWSSPDYQHFSSTGR